LKATPVEYQRTAKRKSDQELLVLRDRYRQNLASLDPLEKEYLRIVEAEVQRRGLEGQVRLGSAISRGGSILKGWKDTIIERLEHKNYPEQITLDEKVTIRFPTFDMFVLESDGTKITRKLSDSADFNYLLDLINAAETVSWSEYKPPIEKKEKKEEKPLEMPEEKLRSTLLPYVEAARVKPLSEFFGPAKVETGRRMKIAREFQERADAITTRIYTEIYSFKPLGRMTEFGEALGGEPSRGKAVTTPLGTFVFAKNRVPDSQTTERWRIQHAESQRLNQASARYTVISFKPQPNTVTGNFRVVEEGRYFREQGLLSPEEDQHLHELEQFWASHPDLDRERGWGVYRESGKIELPTPMYSEPEEIKAYWGKSPRGLTALWVEVRVKGELRVRGHREMRAGSPEQLAEEIRQKLRSSVEEAGLPVTALLTKRTQLGKQLLISTPEDLLPKTAFRLTETMFSEMKNVIGDKARKQTEFDICQAEGTFLAEVGHCGDKNGKPIGRFLIRSVRPEEIRDLAAKFEVTCVAEPDKPSIQCFDPQSGQVVKEWKL
jgi:hypothetical protein